MNTIQRFQEYLHIVSNPDKVQSVSKIEFLNPDDTVAYALGSKYIRRYGADSRAFLQDGNINISLNNGQRRTASIRIENLDNAFDFAINKLWFGQRLRLSKGVVLSDGSEFLIPQGVFYINSPKIGWKPNSRIAEYSLVDKWSYLDGTLFGNLENTHEVPSRANIFDAMQGVLNLSRFTHKQTTNYAEKIDGSTPIFTDFYNTRTVIINGESLKMNLLPKKVTTSGGTYGKILLDLNSIIVGQIGYDRNGRLRVDPSQDDIDDTDKPVVWSFSGNNKMLFSLDETATPASVYNDVIIWGENLDGGVVGARATNYDPTSDMNANLIGLKTYIENSDINYSNEQCQALADWTLKRKTVLQKSISLSCSQILHLNENDIISIQRTDKPGSPIEKHLIQSITLPINETSTMSITATSICDFPQITRVSMSEFLNAGGES